MLESKKYSIIEWIISVADERVLDTLQLLRDRLEADKDSPSEKSYSFTTSKYSTIQSRKVDIDQLKQAQNYKETPPETLKQIAREANINEPIEDLLADLKRMG